MTSDHPKVLISYGLALLLAIVGAAPVAAETIAATNLEAAELLADLPWAFEVTVGPHEPGEPGGGEEAVKTTWYRFKSTTPDTTTAPGDVYLRAELTTYEHADAQSARAGFDDLLASADPDIGLSYAWDRLLRSGAVIYHLHAECTFSEETFQQVAGRLEAALLRQPDLRVACRCGGGCREVPAAEGSE